MLGLLNFNCHLQQILWHFRESFLRVRRVFGEKEKIKFLLLFDAKRRAKLHCVKLIKSVLHYF